MCAAGPRDPVSPVPMHLDDAAGRHRRGSRQGYLLLLLGCKSRSGLVPVCLSLLWHPPLPVTLPVAAWFQSRRLVGFSNTTFTAAYPSGQRSLNQTCKILVGIHGQAQQPLPVHFHVLVEKDPGPTGTNLTQDPPFHFFMGRGPAKGIHCSRAMPCSRSQGRHCAGTVHSTESVEGSRMSETIIAQYLALYSSQCSAPCHLQLEGQENKNIRTY
jgi:hypothetical protein